MACSNMDTVECSLYTLPLVLKESKFSYMKTRPNDLFVLRVAQGAILGGSRAYMYLGYPPSLVHSLSLCMEATVGRVQESVFT